MPICVDEFTRAAQVIFQYANEKHIEKWERTVSFDFQSVEKINILQDRSYTLISHDLTSRIEKKPNLMLKIPETPNDIQKSFLYGIPKIHKK